LAILQLAGPGTGEEERFLPSVEQRLGAGERGRIAADHDERSAPPGAKGADGDGRVERGEPRSWFRVGIRGAASTDRGRKSISSASDFAFSDDAPFEVGSGATSTGETENRDQDSEARGAAGRVVHGGAARRAHGAFSHGPRCRRAANARPLMCPAMLRPIDAGAMNAIERGEE